VSYQHVAAAWDAQLPALTKLVLVVLAYHACPTCGLCWPGVPLICQRAGLGPTRVREDLDRLVEAGLIVVHGYATGGRNRATEYVVLPGLPELSTAPCGKCVDNRQTHRDARGLR